ncbi:helix-turn-helix domain-containing protein [Aristophania vespae]|nr:helix-turn-helix domain-containing protein [Aristophania vespae]
MTKKSSASSEQFLALENDLTHNDALSVLQPLFLYGASCEERLTFAQRVHNYSTKAHKPFVIAQLTTIPRILQEEAFFGNNGQSWINQAQGGTLVVSEIDGLLPTVQQELAKILTSKSPSVRLIMASCHDRSLLLKHSALQSELHFWLETLEMRYCVGSERIKAARYLPAGLQDSGLTGFSAILEPIMRDYVETWLKAEISGLHAHLVAEIERPLIMMTLNHTRGNQLKAAALLGLNRNTLRKKMQDLNIMSGRGEKR